MCLFFVRTCHGGTLSMTRSEDKASLPPQWRQYCSVLSALAASAASALVPFFDSLAITFIVFGHQTFTMGRKSSPVSNALSVFLKKNYQTHIIFRKVFFVLFFVMSFKYIVYFSCYIGTFFYLGKYIM